MKRKLGIPDVLREGKDELDALGLNVEFSHLAFALLALENKHSALPELMALLGSQEKIVLFLQTAGGTVMKVPTLKEFNGSLRDAVALYWTFVKKRTWTEVMQDLKLSRSEVASMRKRVEALRDKIQEQGWVHPLLNRHTGAS